MPVGTYTQTFTYDGVLNHIVSESEVRLNNFAAWAFGCKLVCSYFYENRQTTIESSVMFDEDGTKNPTPVFYYVAETNRQSLNLGPALIRLKSHQVAMKMGRYFYPNKPTYNELAVGVALQPQLTFAQRADEQVEQAVVERSHGVVGRCCREGGCGK